MTKKNDHNAIRERLLTAVVRVGARDGLGNITNQLISGESGLQEMYIYRYFIDKDDLIKKAFLQSDANVFGVFIENIPILFNRIKPRADRYYEFMNTIWDYMVKDFDYCKFYIQYYYSIANTMTLRKEHKEICHKLFEIIRQCFVPDINADMVMHRIFAAVVANVMDMAVGITEDTPENRKDIFDFLYSIVYPYIAEEHRL